MGRLEGGSLTIYVDCVSPYSWFGFTNTIRYRPLLNAHGVSVNIIPFFLGGARDGAGNPWKPTPEAKQPYAKQDTFTTGRLLGLDVVPPKEFPILSLFAVRVATYIKDAYPAQKFESSFFALSSGYWSKGINISTTEGIATALKDIFPPSELEEILEKSLSPENKKKVIKQTTEAGAFGAPWIVAVDGDGKRGDWWGNDRWDQVFEHLGVPYKPVEIVPPSGGGKVKL